jgi:peptide/nickel transport system substrate-binding protein
MFHRACGLFFATSVIVATGCQRPVGPAANVDAVARIGVPEADVSVVDMGLRQIPGMLGNEGLTVRGYDGRPRPRLARAWASSADGLTWRFTLNDGVTFHDGTSATAAALLGPLRAAVANKAKLGLYPGLADILNITAVSESELEIKLRRRSTFLLEDLDHPLVHSKDDKSVVGTGPFKTVTSTPTEIVLEPHEAYHQGRPKLDRVVIRPYPTLRTAWASLMRQEIDVLLDVSRDAVEFIGSSDIALYPYLRNYVYLIAFNSSRAPLSRTPVRRALNAAVDRSALIRSVLKGQGVAASGPLWPQHWAYDATLPGYGYDASLAGTILDAAGVRPTVKSEARQTRFTFTCILPEKWLIWERIALEVQKQLYDAGVDMQLEVLAADEFNRRIQAGDFDAAMIEMISGPTYSRPYAFWHWGGEQTTSNIFGYRNAIADRWFDSIRSASNEAEYRVAAGELQRTLLDDPPALFLAWSQRSRAISRRFNVPVEAGRDPLTILARWTINTGATATH